MNANTANTAAATRIDEQYECPSCGAEDAHFSHTFRSLGCSECGHRGDASEFRTSPSAECPNCGDGAPQTHEAADGGALFTCRGCFEQFTEADR